MSEHNDVQKSKAHEPHAPHEEHSKGPSSHTEINPKISADIAYWAREFHVTSQALHEAIRVHGTHVEKVRSALTQHHT